MNMIIDAEAESRLGVLAVKKGWITREELERLLRVQQGMLASGLRRRLGQMMVMHDLITSSQLEDLLELQESLRRSPRSN